MAETTLRSQPPGHLGEFSQRGIAGLGVEQNGSVANLKVRDSLAATPSPDGVKADAVALGELVSGHVS